MKINRSIDYVCTVIVLIWLLLAASLPQQVEAADAKWKAQYWNNRTLSGSPTLTRESDAINYDWGDGSPDPNIDKDAFSVRWTRTVYFPTTGNYNFTATMDDGMRVWVDGTLLIDSWTDSQVHSISSDTWLNAGDHDVKVEYYEAGGKAVAKMSWVPMSGPPPTPIERWRGEYYPYQNLTAPPAFIREDNDINFNWGLNAPGANMPADHFSVRWTRYVTLNPGQVRFSATVDDGVRLWVNGNLLIDQWHDNQNITYTAVAVVPGGSIPIVMEYYENYGEAIARLNYEWIGPVDGGNVVPTIPPPTTMPPTGIEAPPDGPYGVVTAAALNVRSTPEIGDNVITAVPYGTLLELIGRNGGWLKVRLPDGSEGWVGSSYIVTTYPLSNLSVLDL
ncbi:MAG: SH3 domain-containing protein [Anaerolineales bacterium]|nr:SH3 domain-containing protein [Anaerolineales bacterium]